MSGPHSRLRGASTSGPQQQVHRRRQSIPGRHRTHSSQVVASRCLSSSAKLERWPRPTTASRFVLAYRPESRGRSSSTEGWCPTGESRTERHLGPPWRTLHHRMWRHRSRALRRPRSPQHNRELPMRVVWSSRNPRSSCSRRQQSQMRILPRQPATTSVSRTSGTPGSPCAHRRCRRLHSRMGTAPASITAIE